MTADLVYTNVNPFPPPAGTSRPAIIKKREALSGLKFLKNTGHALVFQPAHGLPVTDGPRRLVDAVEPFHDPQADKLHLKRTLQISVRWNEIFRLSDIITELPGAFGYNGTKIT